MAQTFRGSGYGGSPPKKTVKFDDYDDAQEEPYEAVQEHPPFFKFGLGLVEFASGIVFNIVQVTTSTYAFMSSMQGEAVRALNIQELMRLNTPIFTMAFAIAFGVQLVIHMNSQSMSSTWRRLRAIKIERVDARHTIASARKYLTLRKGLFGVCLLLNVVGDARFALLYTQEWVAIGAWIILLTSLSTLVMYDGATRMWGAMQDAKDYRIHRQRNYERDED